MDVEQYMQAVIELFKSGKATDAQWKEMAVAVLEASENDDGTSAIDLSVMPQDDEEHGDER